MINDLELPKYMNNLDTNIATARNANYRPQEYLILSQNKDSEKWEIIWRNVLNNHNKLLFSETELNKAKYMAEQYMRRGGIPLEIILE